MDVENKLEDYLEKIFLDGITPKVVSLSADLYTELLKNFMTKARYQESHKTHMPNHLNYWSAMFREAIQIQCSHGLPTDTMIATMDEAPNGIERAMRIIERRQPSEKQR